MAIVNEMEHASTTSIYTPLDRTKSQIRLVHIQPRSSGDEISCLLHIVSLDDGDCVYEALSYEWGDPGGVRKYVKLDGHTVAVRENLWNALWHLREEVMERVIWIDALAINQDDDLEKGHQVQQMGNVYKRCSRVVAWTGLPRTIELGTTDFECAVDFMKLLSSETFPRQSKHLTQTVEKGDSCFDEDTKISLSELWRIDDERWTYVKGVYDISYWQRLWIIQEVVLAPQILIQRGSFTLAWDDLVDFKDTIWSYDHSLEVFDEFQYVTNAGLNSLMYTRSAFNGWSDDDPEGYLTLVELSLENRDAKCLDVRDHIFGLLGLCTPCCRDAIVAKYSDSAAILCEQVIIHWTSKHYDEKWDMWTFNDIFNILLPQVVDQPEERDQLVALHYTQSTEAPLPLKMFRCNGRFRPDAGPHSHAFVANGMKYWNIFDYEVEPFLEVRMGDEAYTVFGNYGTEPFLYLGDGLPSSNASEDTASSSSITEFLVGDDGCNHREFAFVNFEDLLVIFASFRWTSRSNAGILVH